VAWVAALALGFHALWLYKSSPGDLDPAPARWPRASRIALDRERATLVMFVHPRCPCTSASVAELDRLLTTVGSRVRPWVVVFRPADADRAWDDASLWRRVSALPGVVVLPDDGAEAQRFRAFTSGLVLLYDTRGRRTFSGGITSSRGHEGRSFGQSRIVAILDGRRPDRDETPVFGCALRATAADAASIDGEEAP
jgi:hypothetical protein